MLGPQVAVAPRPQPNVRGAFLANKASNFCWFTREQEGIHYSCPQMSQAWLTPDELYEVISSFEKQPDPAGGTGGQYVSYLGFALSLTLPTTPPVSGQYFIYDKVRTAPVAFEGSRSSPRESNDDTCWPPAGIYGFQEAEVQKGG